MAHIQTTYAKLWKPQDLSLDKIDSQKVFIDNVNQNESNMLEVSKKLHLPVADITALKAIDTTDTTLFTDGMLIHVLSNGIFHFDRDSIATADDINTIQPTVGGGRWLTDPGSFPYKTLTTEALNTLMLPGVYIQNTAANATLARNYPVANTKCQIIVGATGVGSGAIVYHSMQLSDGRTAYREYNGSAWGTWVIHEIPISFKVGTSGQVIKFLEVTESIASSATQTANPTTLYLTFG